MKKELPIAVILLALGAWCCFQFPSSTNVQTARAQFGASDVVAAPGDYNVAQASWQTPVVAPANDQPLVADTSSLPNQALVAQATATQALVTQATAGQSDSDQVTMRAFRPAEFLQVATAGDMRASEEVDRIANGIQELPPFATHTNISSQLFGVSMAATGKYFQTDSGKKSRMEIQCFSPVAKTVLQMSDGRFVYILKSDHQQQKLEFIDLFRLANHRGNAHGGLLPTTWVMGGGIGKAISHYADSFDFQKVVSPLQSQASQGETTYRGIWKAATLLHLMHAGKPNADRPTKVVWADVPRQMPHAIELTFTTTAGTRAVPKQISFFKFSTDENLSTAKEMVRIEFSPFEFKNSLPDELFTLESTDFEATDVTKVYNDQISKLSRGMDKVANQVPPAAGLR